MKKNKSFLKGKVELKSEGGVISVIASDETLDRHGDVLPIDQWDLSKFKSAPRMLVDHNHEVASIVGKWDNARIQDGKLIMDADFHQFTELSRAVKQMVEEGYLNTVSVGFIYNGPEKDGGKPSFELIETSWVTVPANPSAQVIKSAMEKGIDADEKLKIAGFMGKTAEELESSDDVLPDDEDDDDLPPEEEEEKIFASIEEVKGATLEGKESVKVKTSLLMELIGCSEKLSTLTQAELAKVGADKALKLFGIAMKEAAHIVNDSLRKINKHNK